MEISEIVTTEFINLAKKEILPVAKGVISDFKDSILGNKIGEIVCYRKEKKYNNVLLLVHGFNGDPKETFGKTPEMLLNNEELKGWDIYSIGYSSDIFPLIGKDLWSVNPDITKVSLYLNTLLQNQFNDYKRIAFVAHSMGGLVVERCLLDLKDDIFNKISHLLLFGTPSAGLKKAYWVRFWNNAIRDLSSDSSFIYSLRNDWNKRFQNSYPFIFKTLAGSKDEFVPVDSSLLPFDKKYWGVIEGNHLNMIKPKDENDLQQQSYQIILKTLTNQNIQFLNGDSEEINLLLGDYQSIIAKYLPNSNKIDEKGLINLVFALECTKQMDKAIEVLLNHPAAKSNSDILGVIGGRFKRKYLSDSLKEDWDKSFGYYKNALEIAVAKNDGSQIFYHAINLAFLEVVSGNKADETTKYAQLAIDNCQLDTNNMFELATIAEGNLYLGNMSVAEEYYKKAAKAAGSDIRAKESISSNAYYGYQSLMGTKNKDADFIKMLEEDFF